MDLALRPMSTSQVLDRTFHIYRNHFVLLAGIGALVPAALLIMQLSFIPLGFPPPANSHQPPEGFIVLLLGYFACSAFIYVIGNALAAGATVYGVSKLHLGQSVTIGQAYKQVLSRFWSILGTILLISLIVFGSVFVGEIIAILLVLFSAGSRIIFSGNVGASGAVIIAFLWGFSIFAAGLVMGVFFYCKFALAVPACLLEHLPVGAALSRSWRLTKNSFWRIFLLYLLTWILSVVLALVLEVPGQIYTAMVHNKAVLLGVVLQELGGFIAGVVANPIATIAIALIYYDQRVRKEAFDLQLMMEAIGQQQPSPAMAVTAPPMIG